MPRLLRAEQAFFDEVEFDPTDGPGLYAELTPRDAKIAHIGWHVGNIANIKMPDFIERNNLGLVHTEIIPDLVMYSTQLANLLPVPDEAFEYQPAHFALPQVDLQIRRAAGCFSKYVERLEHGEEPTTPGLPRRGAILMYRSAIDLAVEFGSVDVAGLHRARMVLKMKRQFPELAEAPSP